MNRFQSIIAKATVLSLVIGLVGVVRPAQAATLTAVKDVMTRVEDSTPSDLLSDHEIMFVTATGVATTQTIVITMPSDFDGSNDGQGALDFNDVDLFEDTTADGTCDGTAGTLVAAAPGATEWSAAFSGTENRVLTFTSGGASAIIAAGSEVCVKIGENATGGTANSQYINPTTAGSYVVTIAAGTADSGSYTLAIVDDDTVAISATVASTLTFDLDVTTSDTCAATETGASYEVNLGTITTADTRVSGATDTVNSVCIDLSTNATGGAIITVDSANGSSGLVSTSVPGDTIPSASATMADGTENYGICVVNETATTGTFDDNAPFDNASCAANTETNVVGGLTTSPQTILDSDTNPIAGGRAQVLVNAAIASTTEAHADYGDTLTFVATGTF